MKIAVIGAGAWGTAFSMHLAKKGLKPLVWVYEKELYDILKKERVNTYYLPSFILPEEIQFTTNLEDVYSWSDNIVIATPSFALRTIIAQFSQNLVNKHVLILTKGLEVKSHLRMSEVVK
ncbi:MAG TPA: hypothetical protein DDW17_00375, partial [Deltaproteobacteria bacterium]|nr:hypothetical protein [Deltaproteobacteria bacterium]